ncbi:MAG: hypothetical protein ACRDY1_12485 [Acidimicrobiales bacterium]
MSYLTGRGRVHVVVALTAIAGLVCGFGTAQAVAGTHKAHRTGVFVPTSAREKVPLHGGSADSLNWAGYAVTPGSGITAVDSTFTVPTAGSVPPGFSATWAGIGGYTTTDLIQAGVSEQSLPSNSVVGDQYYAWYEILPASETQITGCTGDANCTVNPGDTVTVDIHNVSGNDWSVNLSDAGHWTYSIDLTYASSESSAEWIQEAPTLVVQTIPAPVGDVAFGPTSTYSVDGTTQTIAAGDPTVIEESPFGGVNEATTSDLASDGQSFDVCVYAQSCPAP